MRSKEPAGFSLIPAILLVFLMTVLLLYLHLQVIDHWRLTRNTQDQLHSMVVAENGLEYARALIPHLDFPSLFMGMDGRHAGTSAGWRNPMPLEEARGIRPDEWRPAIDDGLPYFDGRLMLPQGFSDSSQGTFFLRFSNNPDEPPTEDHDRIIVVRSLGVVPSPLYDPFLPRGANAVSLLEAVFRKEETFLLPSPLTLFGSSGQFVWNGERFQIESEESSAISVISAFHENLMTSLTDSLSSTQRDCVTGGTGHPAIQDATLSYQSDPVYSPVFEAEFWEHLTGNLPEFADSSPGLDYWPDGGTLDRPFSGILFVEGDCLLAAGAKIDGLLIHLGRGRLTLSEGSQVNGGVWMSNLECSQGVFRDHPIGLTVEGDALIRWNKAIIVSTITKLPLTQLGWRILFPEMGQ